MNRVQHEISTYKYSNLINGTMIAKGEQKQPISNES